MAGKLDFNLNAHQFWLLHYLHRDRWPVSELTSPNLELHLNRRRHYRTVDQLVELLDDLIGRGFLYGSRHDLLDPEDPHFRPRPDEIRNELEWGLTIPGGWGSADGESLDADGPVPVESYGRGLPLLFLGLTTLGGAAWEDIAQPEWDRYLEWLPRFASTGLETLCSANKAVLKRYLELRVEAGEILVSLDWDLVEPWDITYWKLLPQAHRIRCEFRCIESEAGTEGNYQGAKLRFELWRRRHQFSAVTHRLLP